MSNDMHHAGGQDYYSQNDHKHKDYPEKTKPEEEKCFYKNGVKYKLVFDSEIKAWVREIVPKDEEERK
jgi:hypothetical protein